MNILELKAKSGKSLWALSVSHSTFEERVLAVLFGNGQYAPATMRKYPSAANNPWLDLDCLDAAHLIQVSNSEMKVLTERTDIHQILKASEISRESFEKDTLQPWMFTCTDGALVSTIFNSSEFLSGASNRTYHRMNVTKFCQDPGMQFSIYFAIEYEGPFWKKSSVDSILSSDVHLIRIRSVAMRYDVLRTGLVWRSMPCFRYEGQIAPISSYIMAKRASGGNDGIRKPSNEVFNFISSKMSAKRYYQMLQLLGFYYDENEFFSGNDVMSFADTFSATVVGTIRKMEGSDWNEKRFYPAQTQEVLGFHEETPIMVAQQGVSVGGTLWPRGRKDTACACLITSQLGPTSCSSSLLQTLYRASRIIRVLTKRYQDSKFASFFLFSALPFTEEEVTTLLDNDLVSKWICAVSPSSIDPFDRRLFYLEDSCLDASEQEALSADRVSWKDIKNEHAGEPEFSFPDGDAWASIADGLTTKEFFGVQRALRLMRSIFLLQMLRGTLCFCERVSPSALLPAYDETAQTVSSVGVSWLNEEGSISSITTNPVLFLFRSRGYFILDSEQSFLYDKFGKNGGARGTNALFNDWLSETNETRGLLLKPQTGGTLDPHQGVDLTGLVDGPVVIDEKELDDYYVQFGNGERARMPFTVTAEHRPTRLQETTVYSLVALPNTSDDFQIRSILVPVFDLAFNKERNLFLSVTVPEGRITGLVSGPVLKKEVFDE